MLCTLANNFPDFIAGFLNQGLALRRRFREETVTDLLMGSLMTAALGRVIVEFPNEPQTGADMEWNFVDPRKRTFFRLIIQAKQAYGDGEVWSRHCYREIYHSSRHGSTLQAQTLCDTARRSIATYPIYLLYHTQFTIDLARSTGNLNIQGVNVADGFEIEQLVKAAKGRTLRTRNRSLKTIAPLLLPLSSLFCPASSQPLSPTAFAGGRSTLLLLQSFGGRASLGIPMPPDPETMRGRIVKIREATRSRAGEELKQDTAYAEWPDVPQVSDSIPEDIEEIVERREALPSTYLDRWRLTFVSTTANPESA